MEELEAIDWYDQRIDATKDAELRAILTHNRDEEKEHAAMLLAWLASRDPRFAAEIAKTLTPVLRAAPAAEPGDGSLAIGALRGTTP